MPLSLSIVIPAYNEEKCIAQTLTDLMNFLRQNNLTNTEVIVTSDGSTDQTNTLVNKFISQVKLIKYSPNQGKGYAVRIGMLAAKNDYILFMDADLATPITEITHFLNEIGDFDIAIANRQPDQQVVKRTFIRGLAGSMFQKITKLLFKLGSHDTQCGFKLFKKAAAKDIFSRTVINRWTFDVEVLYLASRLHYSVKEIDVPWQEKGDSKMHLVKDSFKMFRDLLYIKFINRHLTK